jgi:hypothetical protein
MPFLRVRLRTLIICVVVLSIALFFIAPYVHLPSRAEKSAIRIATTQCTAMIGRKPSYAQATRISGDRWIVRVTEVINPDPGGYRVKYHYEVDARGKCRYLGCVAGGAY